MKIYVDFSTVCFSWLTIR